MAKVLMVSKPVQPPWDDSGKNLVKEIACNLAEHQVSLMISKGVGTPCQGVTFERIYKDKGGYSPGLSQNIRVMLRLLLPDDHDIYHFFFAPNPSSSKAGRIIRKLKANKAIVHTISSIPASFEGIDKLMFAHRVVAVSRNTAELLTQGGVKGVVHIPPGIDPIPVVDPMQKEKIRRELGLPEDKRIVLYAGDYQFSRAADTCAKALPMIMAQEDIHFVFACRIKQELSRAEEKRIRDIVARRPWSDRVHFFNELPNMVQLVGAVDLQVLPANSLFAKMDIPLVLLEGFREGIPAVVSDCPPLTELVEDGAALSCFDAESLATAVLDFFSKDELARSLAQRGREVVASKYNAAKIAQSYSKLYHELLSEMAVS